VPAVDEAEIITNLNPFDEARQGYSDWRVIQRYSDYAYERIINGHPSQQLLDALLQAFTHEHLFARIPVARCLGQADAPASRAALLTELLRPSLSWDVQQACLDALDTQIRNASEPALRALRRWLVLDTAHQAARSSVPAARALANLAAKSWESNEYLVTRTAFEILRVPATTAPGSAPSFELLSPTAAPVADWIHELVGPDDYAAAGKGWEPKYRVVSISNSSDAGLQVSLTETTWEEGASFQCAMRRQASSLSCNADRILSAWLGGAAYFPGVISIHCIIVTRDRKVVETRRGAGTLYPGRWSISFEEQVTTTDFKSEIHDAATAAALRGFTEEFGLSAGECRIRIISAIVEFPIVNPVLVALIETGQTADSFRRAFENSQDADAAEIDEISFVSPLPHLLKSEIERADLHPTAAIRALMLSRLLG
jgi:hypothetical protein